MKGKFNFKLATLCIILSALLVVPALAQAPEHPKAPAQAKPQEQPKAPAPAQPPEHPKAQPPAPAMEKGAPKGPEQAQVVGQKMMGDQFKQRRMEMIKGMKLPPDKEKAILAVEEKYVTQRKATIENLKKAHADLETALAAPTPDEGKIKELVNMLLSGQDAVFNSFKSQRDEEMALMTPVEQGKYLMMMSKMRQEMMGKKAPAAKKKK